MIVSRWPIPAAMMLVMTLLAGTPVAFAQSGVAGAKLDMWRPGDPGERLMMQGRVITSAGKPVAGAQIHVRQADGSGVYTQRYSGTLTSAADGSYGFGTALPGQYSSAKHIHLFVSHPKLGSHSAEIRFKGDPNNADAAHDKDAIAVESANINGVAVLLGEFNIVLPE